MLPLSLAVLTRDVVEARVYHVDLVVETGEAIGRCCVVAEVWSDVDLFAARAQLISVGVGGT
jgi:hypothetical protein